MQCDNGYDKNRHLMFWAASHSLPPSFLFPSPSLSVSPSYIGKIWHKELECATVDTGWAHPEKNSRGEFSGDWLFVSPAPQLIAGLSHPNQTASFLMRSTHVGLWQLFCPMCPTVYNEHVMATFPASLPCPNLLPWFL